MEEEIKHFRHELSHWTTDFEEEYAKEMTDIFDRLVKELENSIPISVIEKKIKTLDGALDYVDIAEYSISTITDKIDVLQELLDERSNTDE